jgi:hypothetical protein
MVVVVVVTGVGGGWVGGWVGGGWVCYQVLEYEAVLQNGHSGDPNWGCWCLICHEGRVV